MGDNGAAAKQKGKRPCAAEVLGIPSVMIAASGFVKQAKSAAASAGLHELRVAEYPGAFASHTREELQENTRKVLWPQVKAGLTGVKAGLTGGSQLAATESGRNKLRPSRFAPDAINCVHPALSGPEALPPAIQALRILEMLVAFAADADSESIHHRRKVDPREQARMELLTYIKCNSMKQISLLDAAREFGKSRSAFCAWFKSMTGKTFAEAVIEAKLKDVCERLRHTVASIGLFIPFFFAPVINHIEPLNTPNYTESQISASFRVFRGC